VSNHYFREEAMGYFNGLQQSKLFIQQCPSCNQFNFIPRPYCPHDMGELKYIEASGKGKIVTFTIVEKSANPNETPFVLAIVELAEGPALLSRIIGTEPEDVTFNQEVEVVFVKRSDEVTLPYFKPI